MNVTWEQESGKNLWLFQCNAMIFGPHIFNLTPLDINKIFYDKTKFTFQKINTEI